MTVLPPEHIFQESDSYTCGPCCLAMVYSLRGKQITLQDILKDFNHPEKGKPTYVSQLANHLMQNDIQTNVVISASKLLSPAWKHVSKKKLIENLEKWLKTHADTSWGRDAAHLLIYLKNGGTVMQDSYSAQTIRDMLDAGSLVILCVDEDWLWGHRTKLVGEKRVIDEINGKVEGHFVLVTGYEAKRFRVLDPFPTHIEDRHGEYDVDDNQLVNASLTWDPEVIEILS